MIRSTHFFLLLFCIFSLQKVFAGEQRAIFELTDLISAIDNGTTDSEKVNAVHTFLVSQSTEWEQSENCRLANTSWGRRRSEELWSRKVYFLHLENNPQSPNAVEVLRIYRDFEQKPKSEKTYPAREQMFAQIDKVPLDPVPDCSFRPEPLDYSKLSPEHNRILVLARIDLGKSIYDAYLRKYWTPRGRSEVYQKLISCQNEFKDLLGASLFCFTSLTQDLNPLVQNRALNFLQEAALLTILLDRNPLKPCLGKNLQLLLSNIDAFYAGSVFSPLHNIQEALSLHMKFSCVY